MHERDAVCDRIEKNDLPHSTIAAIAEISGSKVSEYVRKHRTSGQTSSKIEAAVNDLADLVEFMKEHIGVRPDLKDVAGTREAIKGLRAGKELHQAQTQLETATAEANDSLSQMLAG